MQLLPFRKVQQIEEMFGLARIEDLVLVLSQAESDEYLLVYNAEKPPTHPRAQTRPLSDLVSGAVEYARFDGPVVGFGALDVLLADLPTYGVTFYSIESLFRRRGEGDALKRTSERLARRLIEQLRRRRADASRRWLRDCARAIQLALPTLLAGQELENLVAVVLPANPSAFLDLQSCRLIYNCPGQPDDLSQLLHATGDPGAHWIAAIEEALLVQAGASWPIDRLVDLRITLRHMGYSWLLQQTCRALAHRFWGMWQDSRQEANDERWRDIAYRLAAESWLASEDVEDLVALFPHSDFIRFADQGDALRVYRTPALPTVPGQFPPGPRRSAEALLAWPKTDATYQVAPLSFGALAPILRNISPAEPLDLGVVLWKAGRITEVARTFWLIARDMLERPAPALPTNVEHAAGSDEADNARSATTKSVWTQISVWTQVNATPQDITEMAIRAALIYSLTNPWLWRQGRYDLFLRDCYEHMLDCLLNQINDAGADPSGHYYKALYAWYGGAISDDPVDSLNDMVRACRAFLESYQERPSAPAHAREMAARLLTIGERLLHPDRDSDPDGVEHVRGMSSPFPVLDYLRRIVDSRIPITAPSDLFEPSYQTYCLVQARWIRLRNATRTNRPLIGDLTQLLGEYRRLRRIAHAPAHELAFLSFACAESEEYIRRLISAGGIEALIKITLRNPWATLDLRERLIFDVENVGGSAAEQFHLTLERSSAFEFLSPPSPLEIARFMPGERRRIEYQVRVKEIGLTLNLACTYRDNAGLSLTMQQVLRPEVRQPSAARVKPQGNPYEVGRPVSSVRFFGRRAELEQVLTRLGKGSTQPILLRGPRRMGKTSLLYQLKLVLKERQERRRLGLSPELALQIGSILPVTLSLQAVDLTIANYNIFFLQAIIRDICGALGITVSPRQLAEAFDQSFPAHAFLEQMNWIFAQHPRERLLILIDEWDEIYRDEYKELGKNLRYIVQEEQRISWMFSSTWTLGAEGRRFGSPWFNILDRIELKEMDWESATRLVNVPSREVGVEWRGEAVVDVLEQSGRRPYLIQLLCSRIIDQITQRRTNTITIDTVEMVINQLIADAQVTEQYLGFLWSDEKQQEREEARWLGRLILWALDRNAPDSLPRREIRREIEQEFLRRKGTRPLPEHFYDSFDDQMKWLTMVADAVAEDDSGCSFSFPLVQRWVHHVIAQRRDQIEWAFDRLGRE